MSTKHNVLAVGLIALGIALVVFFGVATLQNFLDTRSENIFEGITRPQTYSQSPKEGNASASLVIYEFGDFACPGCKEAQPIIERIFGEYGGTILHVWKDFPHLGIFSEQLAAAARCANAQGKFWAYHDWLFSHNNSLDESSIQQGAEESGLDMARFTLCVSSGETKALVDRDFLEALALGIDTTPTFVIGDVALVGVNDYEHIEQLIISQLGE